MRVVIDTNCLKTDQLARFLAMSRDHVAVLTEYMAIESFRPDTLQPLAENISVIRQFPGQALMLRSAGVAVELNPALAAMGNRMVDRAQTRGLSNFYQVVDRALAGGKTWQRQIAQRGEWAVERLKAMLGEASETAETMAEFEGFFTTASLKDLRTPDRWGEDTRRTIIIIAGSLAEKVMASHSPAMPRPRHDLIWNHFLYRSALCHTLHLAFLARNGVKSRRPDRVRNDNIDLVLATFATYFNGLMSDDLHLIEVHIALTYILRSLAARVPPDYVTWAQNCFAD